ncbi:hypothetical protein ROA7450_03643 [Roseovarius albus]|uniref:HTH cro/C1-type domain-containing protein n=1 Tax=Roseovarius albus TaxID=1247867 RepID=A0A1X7A1H7_9RHOB|nr:hypothetical protein ROA7450_03643 [Roseovarius albus]
MSNIPSPAPAQFEPAALRRIFGDNLRMLCDQYPSVSSICRELRINRTQFNRYLSGDSFPRPDILSQICQFFDVDARILLEPINELKAREIDLLNHPILSGFFGSEPVHVDERLFPSGFYRFVRPSFIDDTKFALGLVHVKRASGYTFVRGFEPREALRMQGLSTHPQHREYRGMIMRQEEGIMAIVSHRNSMSCSFNFLSQETSFQSNLWEGYATRTTREKVSGRRATRMVYEHLGHDMAKVMQCARQSGLISREDVPPFHLRLLRLDQEFR